MAAHIEDQATNMGDLAEPLDWDEFNEWLARYCPPEQIEDDVELLPMPSDYTNNIFPQNTQAIDFDLQDLARKRKRSLNTGRLKDTQSPQAGENGQSGQQHPRIDNSLDQLLDSNMARATSSMSRLKLDLETRPFDDDSRSPRDRFTIARKSFTLDPNAGVNGYLKFVKKTKPKTSSFYPHHQSQTVSTAIIGGNAKRKQPHDQVPGFGDRITLHPPHFGNQCKLDDLDRQLFDFYTTAVCGGRTLLPKTNVWLTLASVAEADPCTRHAALAMAAGYALDYFDNKKLLARANHHHKRSRLLLADALKNISTIDVGQDDSVVAALQLLWYDDIVQWEERRPAVAGRPRWFVGAEIARAILNRTDPGQRYWHPGNVQAGEIRRGNANMCGYTLICALPAYRLRVVEWKDLYMWLLQGGEKESRQICGIIGVSPKLLHIFAQITQLSALLHKSPDSTVWPRTANELWNSLIDFRQTSEFTDGSRSTQQILDSCVLNEEGLVDTVAEVTELSAETWVQAAKIYLLCRFFRYSRRHPMVLASLKTLMECLQRLPMQGSLFSAQAPFFSICIASLVATSDAHRSLLRSWFEEIVTRSVARSSVPPVYKCLKKYWQQMDDGTAGIFDGICPDSGDESSPLLEGIDERPAWWEDMVEWLLANSDELCLS